MRPVLCRSVARSVSDDRVYQDLKEKMREYLFSKMKQSILFFDIIGKFDELPYDIKNAP